MPRMFLVIAAILIAVGVFFLRIPFRKDDLDVLLIFVCSVWGLPFIVVGVLLILIIVNHTVIFDSKKIYMTSMYRKMSAHAWSDVTGVFSTGATAILTITFNDGRRIRVSQYLMGMRALIATIERQTGAQLTQGREPVIWWHTEKWPL